MDKDYTPAPERPLTLQERLENLETHHEETRKRLHSLQQQLAHERERLDRVLGSEPSIVETPATRDGYGR